VARWSSTGAGNVSGITPTRWTPTIPMQQTDPYIWFYAIDIPTSPRTKLRLTPYPENTTFERDGTATGIIWYSFSIGHNVVNRDTEGKIPSVSMTVQNVTLSMTAFLKSHNGLIGETVRIALVKKTDLPNGTPILDDKFEIQSSRVTEGAVTFTLGQYSLYRVGFPNRRINRVYCAHEYAGAACGYDATRAGAIATCDKTRDGANGCQVHGDDEVTAGLSRAHPARMLIFEGVLRTEGIGV